MLNKDILAILKQLEEDCPDFYALESINCNLASQIAYWIREDRLHTMKKAVRNIRRAYKRKEGK